MITFAELKFTSNDITEMSMRHNGQAGSIFPHRAKALEALEIAKDNVKYVLAKIELETHNRGSIPGKDKDIRITGSAMKSYVDSHPDVVAARKQRQEAEFHYDNVKGLVTTYNTNKDLLAMMQSDQKNEWYSEPTSKAGYDPTVKI